MSSNSDNNSDNNSYDLDDESSILSLSSDENLEQTNNLQLEGGIIKNYNIICELGRGSFSIVWLAYNITNNLFYALKIQNPSEYKDGLDEIRFVSKLPKQPNIFNNLIEYFIEIKESKKYLCSTWELHCSNIDGIIRKGDYKNGLPIYLVKKIMKQLIESVNILHNKYKVFHGDIKTDNILIKGINDKDAFIINKYKEENFFEKYSESKNQFWITLGKDITNISNMKKEDKMRIRRSIHKQITDKIMAEYITSEISKYSIDSKYLENMNISLADFGTHCAEHNYYENAFGTRYYQAPEIILIGKCSFPVDIWAIGCTFYELLSGKLLFDPIKDSTFSRDYYHLCLINETCGNFPNDFLKKTKMYKEYKNYFNSNGNIKNYTLPDENRLIKKINLLNLDSSNKQIITNIFINIFKINPSKRWTINDLSKDLFFSD